MHASAMKGRVPGSTSRTPATSWLITRSRASRSSSETTWAFSAKALVAASQARTSARSSGVSGSRTPSRAEAMIGLSCLSARRCARMADGRTVAKPLRSGLTVSILPLGVTSASIRNSGSVLSRSIRSHFLPMSLVWSCGKQMVWPFSAVVCVAVPCTDRSLTM